MTFDGIRRLSPYWNLALCYGVVTAVGLIPGLLYLSLIHIYSLH